MEFHDTLMFNMEYFKSNEEYDTTLFNEKKIIV